MGHSANAAQFAVNPDSSAAFHYRLKLRTIALMSLRIARNIPIMTLLSSEIRTAIKSRYTLAITIADLLTAGLLMISPCTK